MTRAPGKLADGDTIPSLLLGCTPKEWKTCSLREDFSHFRAENPHPILAGGILVSNYALDYTDQSGMIGQIRPLGLVRLVLWTTNCDPCICLICLVVGITCLHARARRGAVIRPTMAHIG